MLRLLFNRFFVLLYFLSQQCLSIEKNKKPFDVFLGNRIVPISTNEGNLTVASMVQCSGLCLMTRHCQSATYNAVDGQCILDSNRCPVTEASSQGESFMTLSKEYEYFPEFGKSLKFYQVHLSWYEARQKCLSEDADLVILDQEGKNKGVSDYIRYLGECEQWWIGANDIATEGEFLWVNGVKLNDTFTSWRLLWKEPNDRSGNLIGADCTSLIKNDSNNGHWFDKNCNDTLPFICEKS